jgi:hypothetical protein
MQKQVGKLPHRPHAQIEEYGIASFLFRDRRASSAAIGTPKRGYSGFATQRCTDF